MRKERGFETNLKKKIKAELHEKLGIDVTTVRFEDGSDEDTVFVSVFIKHSETPIKRDISFYVVTQTAEIISQSDEHRFPVVFARLNSKQKLAA